MLRRRVAFAAPFVVVIGCAAKQEPYREPRISEPTRPTPPYVPAVPDELVDELEPLSPAKTFYEMCLRAHCNPPPPPGATETAITEPTLVKVVAVRREPNGSRVRLERKPGMDKRWRAVFVDRLHIDRDDGACRITDWDYQQLECLTMLAPEDLVEDGATLRVRVIPPTPTPITSPPTPPPPTTTTMNPPAPRARIIDAKVVGSLVRVRIAVGSNDGIATTFSMRLLDANERPLENGSCKIVRVADRYTECDVQLTMDQVRASSMYARFAP